MCYNNATQEQRVNIMPKKKKETMSEKPDTNLERQNKWREQKKKAGFIARTYWIPKNKVDVVKNFIESLE